MAKRSAGNGDTGASNQARRQRTTVKKQKHTAIFEEVEKLEDLGPRMVELLLAEPEGTRIYLRARDRRTIN
jgi:hypothetical protein